MALSKTYTLNFVGDCMLGRLIDQLLPDHVSNAEEARIASGFRSSSSSGPLKTYSHQTPWGNTLPLLHSADLTLCNLETAATTHEEKWPDKVFNYRMHPANIQCLKEARVAYAGLANNHTLDFSLPGLLETVETVRDAGIAFAGAGTSRDEALRPAVLFLPRSHTTVGEHDSRNGRQHEIHLWAASDHPSDWGSEPNFHLIDYSPSTRSRLKSLINSPSPTGHQPSLKIFSVHWGPNYSWQPDRKIRDLAHFLVDECGIDIVHGHSSHHIQGVEKYRDALIIYGCGDFVDDYALVASHRNDLSGVWRVSVGESEGGDRLRPVKLDMFPTKIERFQARLLGKGERDTGLVAERLTELSQRLGTAVENRLDEEGSLTVRLR